MKEAKEGLQTARPDLRAGGDAYAAALARLSERGLDADEDLLVAEYGWPNGALVSALRRVLANLERAAASVEGDRASRSVQIHARCVAGVAEAERRLRDRDLAAAVQRGLVSDAQVRGAVERLRGLGRGIAERQAARVLSRDLDDPEDAGTWQAVDLASRMCQASGLGSEGSETVARLWAAIERHNAKRQRLDRA